MRALAGSALVWSLALLRGGGLVSARLHLQPRKVSGSASSSRRSWVADADISRALNCLRLTTPDLELRYPQDAEHHMEEIRQVMLPFQPADIYAHGNKTTLWRPPNYHAEHLWMGLYETWLELKANGSKLSDIFGPYVPIFTHWVQPWAEVRPNKKHSRYPVGFFSELRKVLRKDVPYITLSQNDEGLPAPGADGFQMSEYPNLLVFSGGGYGHVPVPLWKRLPPRGVLDEYSVPPNPRPTRLYFLSYVGSWLHAPRDMRSRAKEKIDEFAAAHGMVVRSEPEAETYDTIAARLAKPKLHPPAPTFPKGKVSNKIVYYYNTTRKGRNVWQEILFSSRFSLTPRGFGRTSYHLAEIMLAGLIPIHVYTDQPWVPYRRLYDTIGFHTDVKGLPALLERLMSMPEEEWQTREAISRENAHSHWSPQGIEDQLWRFISGRNIVTGDHDEGDLVCQRLPDTVRDA